jgi:hypothetical protein
LIEKKLFLQESNLTVATRSLETKSVLDELILTPATQHNTTRRTISHLMHFQLEYKFEMFSPSTKKRENNPLLLNKV